MCNRLTKKVIIKLGIEIKKTVISNRGVNIKGIKNITKLLILGALKILSKVSKGLIKILINISEYVFPKC